MTTITSLRFLPCLCETLITGNLYQTELRGLQTFVKIIIQAPPVIAEFLLRAMILLQQRGGLVLTIPNYSDLLSAFDEMQEEYWARQLIDSTITTTSSSLSPSSSLSNQSLSCSTASSSLDTSVSPFTTNVISFTHHNYTSHCFQENAARGPCQSRVDHEISLDEGDLLDMGIYPDGLSWPSSDDLLARHLEHACHLTHIAFLLNTTNSLLELAIGLLDSIAHKVNNGSLKVNESIVMYHEADRAVILTNIQSNQPVCEDMVEELLVPLEDKLVRTFQFIGKGLVEQDQLAQETSLATTQDNRKNKSRTSIKTPRPNESDRVVNGRSRKVKK